MTDKVFLIGLTGPTGSGKSEVSRILADRHIPVIDADELARRVVEPGSACLKELVREFSDDILHEDGSLNRRQLARRAFATPEEIDRLNILQATFLAMRRAVEGLSLPPELILVDGNRAPSEWRTPVRTIVKGDALSASISAASILAKVSRDRYMEEMARRYPQYEFERHKGYPTKRHYELLRQYGPSPIHRKSFLKKFYAEESG